jgi:hypothetical protein
MYDAELLPDTGSMDVSPDLRADPSWRLYARRVQRNPHMQAYIAARDGGRCAWCGAGSSRDDGLFQLHHRDYQWRCGYGRTIVLPNPTPRRPGRTVEVPDCQACSGERPELFAGCASRLAPVHGQCNRLIEEAARGQAAD